MKIKQLLVLGMSFTLYTAQALPIKHLVCKGESTTNPTGPTIVRLDRIENGPSYKAEVSQENWGTYRVIASYIVVRTEKEEGDLYKTVENNDFVLNLGRRPALMAATIRRTFHTGMAFAQVSCE